MAFQPNLLTSLWYSRNKPRTKNQTSRYITDVQILYFSTCRKKWYQPVVCWLLFAIFLWTGTTCFFFHSCRKISLSKHDLKIVSRSLRIDGPHIFNIWILILSWSRAFSEYKFWISFRMSSLEKVMLDKSLSVLSKSSNSRLLPVLITLHCLANSELHNTALLVKSVTNLFS